MRPAILAVLLLSAGGCVMAPSAQRCYGLKLPFVTVGPCLTITPEDERRGCERIKAYEQTRAEAQEKCNPLTTGCITCTGENVCVGKAEFGSMPAVIWNDLPIEPARIIEGSR